MHLWPVSLHFDHLYSLIAIYGTILKLFSSVLGHLNSLSSNIISKTYLAACKWPYCDVKKEINLNCAYSENSTSTKFLGSLAIWHLGFVRLCIKWFSNRKGVLNADYFCTMKNWLWSLSSHVETQRKLETLKNCISHEGVGLLQENSEYCTYAIAYHHLM